MRADNFSFVLGERHAITVNIGRNGVTGEVVEIAICEAGLMGHDLHLLLSELGLKISRAIQNRNPENGDEIERPKPRPYLPLVGNDILGANPYPEENHDGPNNPPPAA